MPSFVTANTFAHLEILGFPIGSATNTGIFLRGLKIIQRKQSLASALGIQKKKHLPVTMHFLEMIKLQFGKKTPYIALYFTVF